MLKSMSCFIGINGSLWCFPWSCFFANSVITLAFWISYLIFESNAIYFHRSRMTEALHFFWINFIFSTKILIGVIICTIDYRFSRKFSIMDLHSLGCQSWSIVIFIFKQYLDSLWWRTSILSPLRRNLAPILAAKKRDTICDINANFLLFFNSLYLCQ